MSFGGLPVLSRDEESELVAGLLDGDKETFEIFYRLFAGPLTRFVRGWVSHEDAEEVTDDALLQAVASISTYDPARAKGSGLGLWLLVRCRSRAIDRARRTRRYDNAFTSVEHEHLDESSPLANIAAPDDPQRAVEARLELRDFWDSLSAQEREVVALRHFYGLPYEQVSQRMGIGVETVREYAKRARNKLKKRE